MSDLLVMFRGDSFSFTRTVLDQAGEPIDLTDAWVTFTAKRKYNDVIPFIQYDTLDGVSVDTSEVTVTIQPADTAALRSTERFVWDIEVLYGSGDEITFTPIAGRLVVRLDTSVVQGSGS
jgi:hypothetical protein